MPTRSNEQLCKLAQAGDTAACDILLENNLGFIRKIALEQYRSMGLDENDIGIDLDDLVQEGSIGLLNAIPLFDAGRGMKFLTYAAPALRNAMTDCIRAAFAQFEQRMVDKKDGLGFQRVYLDDVLSEDERMLRIEAIADPRTQTPEQIYIQKEQLTELYAALDKLTAREQTYLLYRYGFTDGIEHPLIGAALHFHLSESRTKKVEGEAMDSLRGKLPWWFRYDGKLLLTGALIYLCSADDKAGRQCISAPPTSFFLSLMLPQKGQPFPPERRNCSHTFRGVLQFRLPSAPQRYNTLDFPRKVVCQQGCCSPLLETQSQRGCAPLDTPPFSLK